MAKTEQRRYPQPKERELSEEEKKRLRVRVEQGHKDIYQLAQEFGCSPSQVAGIKAALNR
jgi:transposase-like protein